MAKRKCQESIPEKAERALKEAVRDLIITRRVTNDKVVIWKNGRVAWVPAREIVLEGEQTFSK